jgi:hypothetical protein
MLRAVAVTLVLFTLAACLDDTTASKACAGSSTARACKACCRSHGDKDYLFHYTATTHECTCQL